MKTQHSSIPIFHYISNKVQHPLFSLIAGGVNGNTRGKEG
jgi:hypothetical protein